MTAAPPDHDVDSGTLGTLEFTTRDGGRSYEVRDAVTGREFFITMQLFGHRRYAFEKVIDLQGHSRLVYIPFKFHHGKQVLERRSDSAGSAILYTDRNAMFHYAAVLIPNYLTITSLPNQLSEAAEMASLTTHGSDIVLIQAMLQSIIAWRTDRPFVSAMQIVSFRGDEIRFGAVSKSMSPVSLYNPTIIPLQGTPPELSGWVIKDPLIYNFLSQSNTKFNRNPFAVADRPTSFTPLINTDKLNMTLIEAYQTLVRYVSWREQELDKKPTWGKFEDREDAVWNWRRRMDLLNNLQLKAVLTILRLQTGFIATLDVNLSNGIKVYHKSYMDAIDAVDDIIAFQRIGILPGYGGSFPSAWQVPGGKVTLLETRKIPLIIRAAKLGVMGLSTHMNDPSVKQFRQKLVDFEPS